MTTAAYSRAAGVLAADTQCTYGTRKMRVVKIHEAKGSLIAGAGNVVHIAKVVRWAKAGFPADDLPDFGDDTADFECLIVRPDGSVEMLDESLELLKVTDGMAAIGTGSSYALAAMYCGKTPAEAVEVAAYFDCATSAPVEEMRVPKPKAKIRKGR